MQLLGCRIHDCARQGLSIFGASAALGLEYDMDPLLLYGMTGGTVQVRPYGGDALSTAPLQATTDSGVPLFGDSSCVAFLVAGETIIVSCCVRRRGVTCTATRWMAFWYGTAPHQTCWWVVIIRKTESIEVAMHTCLPYLPYLQK